MIVDGHLDIAWNALAEGRGFDGPLPPGFLISRDSLASAGVGLIFATVFTAPNVRSKMLPASPIAYATPREANLIGRLQVGYYTSAGLRLLTTQGELRSYQRTWRPGRLAAVLLMENADPIESPDQVGEWANLGVRIVGAAWGRTRYCGGTDAPGGLTDLGRRLLRAMARHHLILDLSHMADRSVRESLESWQGPVVATHAGARALNPGQRQLQDSVIAEVGRRQGVVGVSFYGGHLRSQGRAGIPDIVRHLRHFADVAGDPAFVALGSDLDGGFDRDQAAVRSTAQLAGLAKALRRHFSAGDVESIMGGNWLRFLSASLPS